MQTKVARWDGSANQVHIGRPSRWGNPFRIGVHGNRAQVIQKYVRWMWQPKQAALRAAARAELRGKVLGCYCTPAMCHGHILACVAESEE
jgi:hypothetical protein